VDAVQSPSQQSWEPAVHLLHGQNVLLRLCMVCHGQITMHSAFQQQASHDQEHLGISPCASHNRWLSALQGTMYHINHLAAGSDGAVLSLCMIGYGSHADCAEKVAKASVHVHFSGQWIFLAQPWACLVSMKRMQEDCWRPEISIASLMLEQGFWPYLQSHSFCIKALLGEVQAALKHGERLLEIHARPQSAGCH